MDDFEHSKVCLLLSGGLDSLACAHFYLSKDYFVTGLFIDYGQRAAKYERKAANALCNSLGIVLKEISVNGTREWGAGEVRGRNAFLLLTALMNCDDDTSIISIGIHAGVAYWDCSIDFVKQMQKMFDCYLKRRIAVGCPFISFTKAEIYEYCKQESLPISLTYSCENGVMPPCGQCLSCKDLRTLQCQAN